MNLRRRSTFLILLLLGVLNMAGMAVSQQPTIPEDARRYWIQGNAAFKEAQSSDGYVEAESLYLKAVQIAPTYGDAWYNLSKTQEKLGKFDEAIQSLNNFLQYSPNDPGIRAAKDHLYELQFSRDEKAKAAASAQQAETDKAARLRDAQQKADYLKGMFAGYRIQTQQVCMNSYVRKYGGPATCTDQEAGSTNWYDMPLEAGEPLVVTLTGEDPDFSLQIGFGNNGFCIKTSDYVPYMTDYANSQWNSCSASSHRTWLRLNLNSVWNGNKAIYQEGCSGDTNQDCVNKSRVYYVLKQ